MNPIEQWARDHTGVVRIDAVDARYSGEGPPAWRLPMPEVERDPRPDNVGDWWPMVYLTSIRRGLAPDARVLDVGCGPGWPALPLAAHVAEITAVDASPLALGLAARNVESRGLTNVSLVEARAEDLPFPPASFDAVTACEILDVVQDPQVLAREMLRVLKPGGRLVCVVQNARFVLGLSGETGWRRSVRSADCGLQYCCMSSGLGQPSEDQVRFRLDPDRAAAAGLACTDGPAPASPDEMLAELEALKPAMQGAAELHRDSMFEPGTVARPFEQAGFAGLEVSPLNHEMCAAYAERLAAQRSLPTDHATFQAHADALLAAMRWADFDRSWLMAVTGHRPHDDVS